MTFRLFSPFMSNHQQTSISLILRATQTRWSRTLHPAPPTHVAAHGIGGRGWETAAALLCCVQGLIGLGTDSMLRRTLQLESVLCARRPFPIDNLAARKPHCLFNLKYRYFPSRSSSLCTDDCGGNTIQAIPRGLVNQYEPTVRVGTAMLCFLWPQWM